MAAPVSKLQQFDRQLAAVVTPALATHGFTFVKAGREYHRPAPRGNDVTHIVSFQVGPASSSSAGKYTVELGIYYPVEARKIGQEVLKPSIRYTDLDDVRVRLGFLFTPREDRWWRQQAAGTAQADQLREVVGQILTLGLPWFDATDTDAHAAAYNTGRKPKRAKPAS